MKKGQISMNTIVGLIIALTVLIAVIIFFTGKFADVGGDISELQPSDELSASAKCSLACNLAKSTGDIGLWDAEKEECIAAEHTCDDLPAE
jgi:uncharacterized protein (UPF0333 family)